MYPNSLEKLIEYFKKLPSVGQKTAERYAMAVLEMTQEDIEGFSNQLSEIKDTIKKCPICGNLTDKDLCSVCKDNNRDHNTICVVQQPKDLIAIEKLGQYNGVYHVIGGAVSPIKGIMPEDLNIQSLLTRINEETREVIIATNPTMEGDMTAVYICKLLKEKENLIVTRLASGLPMGGNLDYADEVTLSRAIQGRIKQ